MFSLFFQNDVSLNAMKYVYGIGFYKSKHIIILVQFLCIHAA